MPHSASFSKDQKVEIIFLWGKHNDVRKVRSEFAKQYGIERHPRLVPSVKCFRKVINYFEINGSVNQVSKIGRPAESKTVRTDANIEAVRQLIEADHSLSVRALALALDISSTSVWRILRKNIKIFPYKSKTTNVLELRHLEERPRFCSWLLQQENDFHSRIIWTDEKTFEEKCRPNKPNERYWASEDPEVTDEVKVVGGNKVMCFGMIVDGKVFFHWFEKGVR